MWCAVAYCLGFWGLWCAVKIDYELHYKGKVSIRFGVYDVPECHREAMINSKGMSGRSATI